MSRWDLFVRRRLVYIMPIVNRKISLAHPHSKLIKRGSNTDVLQRSRQAQLPARRAKLRRETAAGIPAIMSVSAQEKARPPFRMSALLKESCRAD